MAYKHLAFGALALAAILACNSAAKAVSANVASETARHSAEFQLDGMDLIAAASVGNSGRPDAARAIEGVAGKSAFQVPVNAGNMHSDTTAQMVERLSPLHLALVLLCLSALGILGFQDRFVGTRR